MSEVVLKVPFICFKLSRRALGGLALLLAVLCVSGIVDGSKRVLETMAWMETGPIFRGRADQKAMALTCNVVWGDEYVPQILDILREKQSKMTFFLGGKWAEKNPALVQRMATEGHEIGNHGYDHRHHKNLDFNGNQVEIQKAEAAIKSIVKTATPLFAPPYGEFNQTIVTAADALGYKTIMWTIDTVDWKKPGVSVIANRVLGKAHNGAIVLLHPTDQTVAALPLIISGLQEKGFSLATVSDILP